MTGELNRVIEQVSKEKGIDKAIVISAIEEIWPAHPTRRDRRRERRRTMARLAAGAVATAPRVAPPPAGPPPPVSER